MVNMGVVFFEFGFNVVICCFIIEYGVFMIIDEVFIGFWCSLLGFWGL